MSVKVLFLHGIGGPRRPDEASHEWTAALAEGMTGAGFKDIARKLRDGEILTQFTSYRDLFDRMEEAQSANLADLDQMEVAIVSEMINEMIDVDAGRDADPGRQLLRERARQQLRPGPESQGVMAPVRRLVNAATTLVSAQPLRKFGEWASGKAMVHDFAQVARYLSRTEMVSVGISLDERIRARVLTELGSGPVLVIAHSLGSVVSFEALHQFEGTVPLWITIGSPLGMRTAVFSRVRPRPPATPECVRAWANFWDGDDVIAVRGVLEHDFGPNSSGVSVRSAQVKSRALWAHTATRYLRAPEVAAAAAQALG
jgi:hypothetical protein